MLLCEQWQVGLHVTCSKAKTMNIISSIRRSGCNLAIFITKVTEKKKVYSHYCYEYTSNFGFCIYDIYTLFLLYFVLEFLRCNLLLSSV